jgi:hypothetical protein
MRPVAFLCGAVISFTASAAVAGQTLEPAPAPHHPLVQAGSAAATIILAQDPDPLESYAAGQIQHYVRAISGCELPIVNEPQQPVGYPIWLGRTRRAGAARWELSEDKLGRDGYAAVADDGGLVLVGRCPLGTLFGVYDLIEREFGVRWFVPGELGEVIPRSSSVQIGTFRREFKPSFEYRWVHDGDWALKQRMNVMVQVDGKPVGVNWKWHFHTFAILIPPEKYFDEHPDWFPLVNGRRQKSTEPDSHSTQLCTSNPEVVDKLTEGLLGTLAADPTIEIITLSPNDGGGFCECPNCTALDEPGRGWFAKYSKRLAVLNQQIARRVRERYPHVRIKVGAYAMYALPPEIENYRPESNLIIQLCHIYFCHNHPVTGDLCRPGETYEASAEFLPNQEFRKLAETWAGLTDNLFIYEYYSLGGWARADMLWPMVHTMRYDIPWYRDLGAKGFYTQVGPWNRAPLNYYIAARLAWNADLDVDWLVGDFCRSFFGPAAEPMQAYLAAIEDTMAGNNHCISYGLKASRANLLGPRVFDQPTRDRLRSLLDRAEQLAGDQAERQRVAAVRSAFDACEKSVTAR